MKQEIHDLLAAAPFIPFTIHMSDGRNFTVPHPDFAFTGRHPLTPVVVEVAQLRVQLNPRQIASVEAQHAAH